MTQHAAGARPSGAEVLAPGPGRARLPDAGRALQGHHPAAGRRAGLRRGGRRAGRPAPEVDGRVDVVAGIEARGFIFAAPVAVALGVGFVPVRKVGKLPRHGQRDYQLEYGTAEIEVHADGFRPGQRVLLVDDVLATGRHGRRRREPRAHPRRASSSAWPS